MQVVGRRNSVAGVADLGVLSDARLTDLAPRRAGDGIVDFAEPALPAGHRLEGSSK